MILPPPNVALMLLELTVSQMRNTASENLIGMWIQNTNSNINKTKCRSPLIDEGEDKIIASPGLVHNHRVAVEGLVQSSLVEARGILHKDHMVEGVEPCT